VTVFPKSVNIKGLTLDSAAQETTIEVNERDLNTKSTESQSLQETVSLLIQRLSTLLLMCCR
jgi:hypothetical protein